MQPFTVDDLYRHQHISEVSCSLDGEIAAFTVRSIDIDEDKYVSRIWSHDLSTGEMLQLSRGPGKDQSPAWSPDMSQLAFLSDRGGSPQAYLLHRSGGEARQIGQINESVTALRWLPSGDSLLVTSAVKVDPDRRGARPNALDPDKPRRSPAEVAWRLPYKEDGIGNVLLREIHLFRLDVATGKHLQLTDGPFDVLAFDVAPDGEQVAYSRSRTGRFAHCSDLWVSQADGSNTRRLTHEHAIVMAPIWSPDGRQIAFTGAIKEGDAEPRLWLLDLETGKVRALCSESVDVADPTSVRWEGNHRLVFVRAYRGRHQIVCLDVHTEEIKVLQGEDRQLSAFGRTASHFVYCLDHPSLPSELWAQPRHGGEERQLSRLNPWWDERIRVEAEVRTFDVPDGKGGSEAIEGWLLRGGQPGEAVPLLNDVHGGPATLFMQGKDDERCPKCQSEELFVSLMRAGGTPAELVLYPGETHSFLGSGTPSCREDAARRILDWLASRSWSNAEVGPACSNAEGLVEER